MIKLFISYEEFVLTLILGPILLVVLLNIVVFLKRKVSATYDTYAEYFLFKKMMKELDRKKREEGFMHEWVTVKSQLMGDIMVCKKSGFCNKPYGFFDVKWIERTLKADKVGDTIRVEKELNFEKRLREIAQESGLEYDATREIAGKILRINKEFTLLKLESLESELNNQKGEASEQKS